MTPNSPAYCPRECDELIYRTNVNHATYPTKFYTQILRNEDSYYKTQTIQNNIQQSKFFFRVRTLDLIEL